MIFSGVGFCKEHGTVVCEACGFDGRPSSASRPAVLNREDYCTFDHYSMGAATRNQIRDIARKNGFKGRPDLEQAAKREWRESYQNPDMTK